MDIGDSFRERHALLMLHVWCVHRRLLECGSEGKLLQEALFDRCWEESTVHIRSLGVPELTVNKHLKQLQNVSFHALMQYDNGIVQDHDDFAGALYRNIYGATDENVEEETVYKLAGYVKAQLDALARIPKQEFMQGRIRWANTPGVYGTSSTDSTSDDQDAGAGAATTSTGTGGEDAATAQHGYGDNIWEATLDQRGRTYYWNVVTRETAWEVPEGGVLSGSSDK
jgi:cytochrome b pre-mRNA-processing protein 3